LVDSSRSMPRRGDILKLVEEREAKAPKNSN